MEGRAGVISCLARIPDGLQLLHHEPRLAYCLLRCTSLVLWDVVSREEGRLLSTRQWIREGHCVSSGFLFPHSQSLRPRHVLRHLTGGRFPTLPACQWFFILVVVRKIDNGLLSYLPAKLIARHTSGLVHNIAYMIEPMAEA